MLAGATVSLAQTQTGRFHGLFCIYQVSPACAAMDYWIGDCTTARVTPPGLRGNPNTTRLSIFWSQYSHNLTYPSGSLVGAAFRNVTSTIVGAGAYTFTSQMRILSQTPANPASSPILTQFVDINNFEGACNIRARITAQVRTLHNAAASLPDGDGPPSQRLANKSMSLHDDDLD